MAIDIEDALAGKHGEAARTAAEQACTIAFKSLAKMLNPHGLTEMPEGLERFASGGIVGVRRTESE